MHAHSARARPQCGHWSQLARHSVRWPPAVQPPQSSFLQSRQVQQCKKGGNEWPVTKHPSLPLLCLSLAHARQAELHSRFYRRLFVRVCVALARGAQTCLESSVCEQVLQGCNKLTLGLAFSVCSEERGSSAKQPLLPGRGRLFILIRELGPLLWGRDGKDCVERGREQAGADHRGRHNR